MCALNFHTIINNEIALSRLSKSEIEAFMQSIEENKHLSFIQLTKKSHDTAWYHSDDNDEIRIVEIVKAGGASEELLKYISVNTEN